MIYICFTFAALSSFGLVYSIIESDGKAVVAVFSSFILSFSVAGIIDMAIPEKPEEYPASEYTLEYKNNDLKDRLVESNSSILDLIHNLVMPKSKKKSTIDYANKAIHRGLYNLNTSRQFNMQSLNEKFNYNEDEDKKLSWYWRYKNER